MFVLLYLFTEILSFMSFTIDEDKNQNTRSIIGHYFVQIEQIPYMCDMQVTTTQ